MKNIRKTFTPLFLFFLFAHCTKALPQQDVEMSSKLENIQNSLEEIRGEKFKHQVKYSRQSGEEFGKYLDKNIEQQIPQHLSGNYGKIIRKLGLYRGAEIKDFKALAKQIMQSQAAAYYDPETETFYVVLPGLNQQMLDAVYAHELYHGFQDQHYDLDRYLLTMVNNGLNDDQLLARQAVVEGEATYIMTLWSMKNMFGSVPAASILRMAVRMQSQIDVAQMMQMVSQGNIPQVQSESVKQAINSMKEIPPFMLETMIGAYMKGMAFVFEIQQMGWAKVSELYRRPPVSTEQILHPEKWVSNEAPVVYTWPDFDTPLLTDWKLLETNTLGELQWRIIFNEHNLSNIAAKTAEGWNGDSYAVLENNKSGKLLLFLVTNWDSVEEAEEFIPAYRKVAELKYPDGLEEVSIRRRGQEVTIIEGVQKGNRDKFDDFLAGIKRSSE